MICTIEATLSISMQKYDSNIFNIKKCIALILLSSLT